MAEAKQCPDCGDNSLVDGKCEACGYTEKKPEAKTPEKEGKKKA